MMTICLVECGSDSDCKGNEKCCSMGCHVHCVRPVPGKGGQGLGGMGGVGPDRPCGHESFSLSTAKPGVCPKRKVLQTLVACNNTCSDDTDCPGSNKCCFTGCSRNCVPPARRSSYNPAAVLLGWGWGCRQCPALVASPVLQSGICHLPPEHGPCRGHFYRYAYNPATGTCRVFLYGGCRGNANNFETLKECQRACQRGERRALGWAGLDWTGLDWAAPAQAEQGPVAGWERGAALLRSQLRGGAGGGRAVLKDVKGNGACRRLLPRAAPREPAESTLAGPGAAVVLGPPTPPRLPVLPMPLVPGVGSPRRCRSRACGWLGSPEPLPAPHPPAAAGLCRSGTTAGRQQLRSPGHRALLLGDFNQHAAPSWERGLSLVRTRRYC